MDPHPQRHQPLLRAVVEVALDPAPRLVGAGDDAGPRRHQLRLRLGVGDRRRHQLGEVGQPLFGVGREPLAFRGHRDRAPEAASDDDGAGDGRSDAEPGDGFGHRTRRVAVVVDAGRAPRRQDAPQHEGRSEPPAAPHRQDVRVGPGPRHHRRLAVGIEAHDRRAVGAEDGAHLLRDLRQDLGRRDAPGDEHRHPAQGGLFIGERTQLTARLGVRHRRHDELSEVGQPRLRVRRERVVAGRRDDDCAPQMAIEADGYSDRRPEAEGAGPLGQITVDVLIGRGWPVLVQPATPVTVPSPWYRTITAMSAGRSRPISSATTAKTSSGGVASATSVATRRSAACSTAMARSSRRASVLATAVSTSSEGEGMTQDCRARTPFSTRLPRSVSTLCQYSKARCRTGSVTRLSR